MISKSRKDPAELWRSHDFFGRALRKASRMTRRVWSRFVNTTAPPRHELPYATHVPVLAAMSKIWPIRRVVEFGSGLISTPAFLDTAVFPDMIQLTSFENNQEWCDQVQKRVGQDLRADMRPVAGPMAEAVSRDDLLHADLVFIDDSEAAIDRCATIRKVVELASSSSLVLIHDYEIDAYQDAAGFVHRFVFDAVNPYTGVHSGTPLPVRRLRRLNKLISSWSRRGVAIDDLRRWKSVLS